MPRPIKCRRVCSLPQNTGFHPIAALDNPGQNPVIMTVDEYEVIRLLDLQNLTQEECAVQMNIARTTVTGIYNEARRKLADALINKQSLIVNGGNFILCDWTFHCHQHPYSTCKISNTNTKKVMEEFNMKLAVTYENGLVFQHFGHTEQFKLYEIEQDQIKSTHILSSQGSGHGALADLLKENQVDTLICGGIGGGAKTALADAQIMLYAGVTGEADRAAEDLLKRTLSFHPDVECNHHGEHEHHNCGSHGSCSGKGKTDEHIV